MKKNNFTKSLFVLIFFALSFAILGGGLDINFFTGTQETQVALAAEGTEISNSNINSIVEKIQKNTDDARKGSYYLKEDIYLEGKVWTPISSFSGTLDGCGYTIYGLTIDDSVTSSSSDFGLFAQTSGATIKNLILKDVNINCSSSDDVGAFVGEASNTKLYDCASFGYIKGNYVGGLIGNAYSSSTIINCYSYIKAESTGSYAYGLVGFGSSFTVKKCFFAGTATYAFASKLSDSNIQDVVSYTCQLWSGGEYRSKIDSTKWITDYPSKYSSVYNKNSYIDIYGNNTSGITDILKGVGNIYIETNEYIFSVPSSIGASSSSYSKNATNKYLYFTSFDDEQCTSDKSIKLTSNSDKTFTVFSIERNFGESGNDLLGVPGTIFTNDKTNSKLYNNRTANALANKTTLTFQLVGWNTTYANSMNGSTTNLSFSMPREVQGAYVIKTYSRGKLVTTQTGIREWANVCKRETTSSTHIVFGSISSITNDTTDENEKKIVESGAYTSAISASPSGSYGSYKRPYGESYTVTFKDEDNSKGYLDKIKTNGNYYVKSALLTGSPSFGSTLSNNSVTITDSPTALYHYFNNIFKITLKNSKKEINGQTTGLGYSASNLDDGKTVTVMLYGKISDKGIGYGGNSYTTLTNDNYSLYPIWSKYRCTKIVDENNNTIFTNKSGDYGDPLTSSITCWSAVDALEWYPVWEGVDVGVTVSCKDADELGVNNGTLNGQNLSGLYTTDRRIEFTLSPNGGYKLNNIVLTFQDDTTKPIKTEEKANEKTVWNWGNDDGDRYYGCELSKKANNDALKVTNAVNVVRNIDSGVYTITFAHLIGIKSIQFNCDKIEYNVEIYSKINSTVTGYNESPIKIEGQDVNKNNAYKGLTLSVNDDKKSLKFELKDGYMLEENVEVSVGADANKGAEVEIGYGTEELALKLTSLEQVYETDTIKVYLDVTTNCSPSITFNVNKDSRKISELLEGVGSTHLNDWFTITDSKGDLISSVSAGSDSIEVKGTIKTDDVLNLNFNLEDLKNYEIEYGKVDIKDGQMAVKPTVVKSGDSSKPIITLSAFALYADGNVEVNIDFNIPGVSLTVVTEVDGNIISEETKTYEGILKGYTLNVTKEKDSKKIKYVLDLGREYYFDINEAYESVNITYECPTKPGTNNTANIYSRTDGSAKSFTVNSINENATLTFVVTSRTINVVKGSAYKFEGETLVGEITLESASKKYGETIEFGDMTKLGYTFEGFYITQKDDKGKIATDTFGTLNKNTNYILGSTKTGYYTISLENTNLYIIAIYRSKKLTIKYDIEVVDEVQNNKPKLDTELINTDGKLTSVEFGQTYKTSDLPSVSIGGMYDFAGWKTAGGFDTSKDGVIQFTVEQKDTKSIDFSQGTITLTVVASKKKMTVTFYSDETCSTQSIATISTWDYGESVYKGAITTSSYTHKFTGWICKQNGTKYLTYDESSGAFTNKRTLDIQQTDIDFYADWSPKTFTVIFKAGGLNNAGTFPDGKTEHTAQVTFGTNNYTFSDGYSFSNGLPTYTPTGASLSFVAFRLNNNTNITFDPRKTDNTPISADYIGNNIIFTAYYQLNEISSVSLSAEKTSWIYGGDDGQFKGTINLNFAGKQNTVLLNYSYQWYKDGLPLSGATSDKLENIQNVKDSGAYYCEVTANVSNSLVASSSDKVTTKTNEITISISPKELSFGKNNEKINVIEKVYDNTTSIPNDVQTLGACFGENVTLVATYNSANVGENIPLTIKLSNNGTKADLTNYAVPTDVTGKITPYILEFVLKDASVNYIVKNGADDKQNDIKEYYTLSSTTSRFLTTNNFGISYTLVTSQNKVRDTIEEYKQDNGEFSILCSFDITNGAKNNFQAGIEQSFFIKVSDENVIKVSVNILSNDTLKNGQVVQITSDIATLNLTNIASYKNTDGNQTPILSVIEHKNTFASNPTLNIALSIIANKDGYGELYWIENWTTIVDGTTVANSYGTNKNISYTVSGSEGQIIINCYITRLGKVNFDYNLASGETLSTSYPQDSKFAIQTTIATSESTYQNSVLPNPARIGFKFVGWFDGTAQVLSSQTWVKKTETTLTAKWELEQIELDKYTINEKFVFDGKDHTYTFTITNKNEKAIEYKYDWTYKGNVKGTTGNNTVVVRNVKNSGEYSLTITATFGSATKSVSAKLTVTVDSLALLNETVVYSKTYDTNDTFTKTLSGANGETVVLSGKYTSKNAGATLNVDILDYIVEKNNINIDTLYKDNYSIDYSKIDKQESKILPKDVTLDIGKTSKFYDGKVAFVEGAYNNSPYIFTYKISSANKDTGTYAQSYKNINIEIEGDEKSNYNFTIVGTMDITCTYLTESDIEWIGDTILTFDGKVHTLSIKVTKSGYVLPQSDETTSEEKEGKYTYKKDGITISGKPITVGIYTVSVVFDGNNYKNDTSCPEFTCTLTIDKRTIGISYADEIKKEYDGTTDVPSTASLDKITKTNVVLGYEPSYIYAYSQKDAGTNINMIFVLNEEDSNSENYELSFTNGTLKGEITKKEIDIDLTDTKEYDGRDTFIVNVEKIYVTTPVEVDGVMESVAGNITFAIKDIKIYSNDIDSSKITNNLTIGGQSYDTNYTIGAFTYNLEITKAKLIFSSSPDASYVYDGKPREFEYSLTRQDNDNGATKPTTMVVTYQKKSTSEVYQDVDYAETVGDYKVFFNLNSDDDKLYTIATDYSSNLWHGFSITKRNIVIYFNKQYAYNTQTHSYTGSFTQKSGVYCDILPKIETSLNSNTLGESDTIAWKYTTKGIDCGTYYYKSSDDKLVLSEDLLTIYRTSSDVDNRIENYEITTNSQSFIAITKATIDISDVKLEVTQGEYSASVHNLVFTVGGKVEEHTFDTILLKRDTSTINKSNVLYAGVYSLTILLNNYEIANNKPFTYTITKRDVDIEYITKTKTYDGTTKVPQEQIIMQEGCDFFDADKGQIKVIGNYESADVQKTNIKVTFELNSSNYDILYSYNLKTTTGSGTITVCNKTLTISGEGQSYEKFFDGNIVSLDITMFTPNELENEQIISGQISFNQVNVGTYKLSEQVIDISQLQIKKGETIISLDNYKLSFEGTVYIKHAIVEVLPKDLTKIYNASEQYPTIECTIYNFSGNITSDDLENGFYTLSFYQGSLSNEKQAINAGKYGVVLTLPSDSNYKFAKDDNGQILNVSTLDLGEIFTIEKREIEVNVTEEISRRFKSGQNATYSVQTKDVIDPSENQDNGLLSSHSINAVLSTNSDQTGTYTVTKIENEVAFSNQSKVYIKSIEILNNNDNSLVTDNYVVKYLSCTIIIRDTADEFDIDNIQSLVYNGTDKAKSGEFYVSFTDSGMEYIFNLKDNNVFKGETVISNLKYNGESATEIIFVGQYSVTLTILPTGFENKVVQEVTFNVEQKEITNISCDLAKYYDATSTVYNIETTDICTRAGTRDDVTILGYYYDLDNTKTKLVGNYSIMFELIGEDAYNYKVTKVLSGKINLRPITIKVIDGVTLTYANKTQDIAYSNLTITSGSVVTGETLTGYITITKLDAGTYTLLESASIDNLLVLSGENDVTSNYEFTLDGNIEIKTKQVEILVNSTYLLFDYNGAERRIEDYALSYDLDETDSVYEMLDGYRVVTYDAIAIDAGNYTATISSNSTNVNFIAIDSKTSNLYPNNEISFRIKQKSLRINIGEVQKIYNPTNDHKTELTLADVSDIVAGQTLEGYYKLSKSGLGCGKYDQEVNESGYIVFENIKIYDAYGNDILSKNYNIISQTGLINIIPFTITDAYIANENKSVTYDAQEALSKISFAFTDTNGTIQTITSNDTTWGTIALIESSAINVGTYHISVTINNCELDSTIFASNQFEFNIIQKEITDIIYDSNKYYDATGMVKNVKIADGQLCGDDDITITGVYVDENNAIQSNASENSYNILFAISDYDNFPAKNYKIADITARGYIQKQPLTLSVNLNEVYLTSGEYVLDYDETTMPITNGTLATGQTLSGSLKITIKDFVGLVDLSQVDISGITIQDTESVYRTSNYTLSLDGSVAIEKAKVSVKFDDISTSYTYSASEVVITPSSITLTNSSETTIPTLTILYNNNSQAPKDVGTYEVTVQLQSPYYEVNSDAFTFSITAYDFVVTEITTTFAKYYGEIDPSPLLYTLKSPLNENITLYFTRADGEAVGVYDMYLDKCDNQNYNVSLASGVGVGLFAIKKTQTALNVVIKNTDKNVNILQKQYDAKDIGAIDISQLDFDASGELIIGTITFDVGKDVGEYGLMANGWTLICDNFENFNVTSEVNYKINQRVIKINVLDGQKAYDSTKVFYGTLQILDEEDNQLDSTIYKLQASGEYTDSNVGTNIPLNITLSGDTISNYTTPNVVYGGIAKRQVKVVPNSEQGCTYGEYTEDVEILYQLRDAGDYGERTFKGDYASEITGGKLYIEYLTNKTKFVAGSYPIKSTIQSNNFDLSYDEDVYFTIKKKELTLASADNFTKVYDGSAQYFGEIIITGCLDNDEIIVTAQFYDSGNLETPSESVNITKVVKFTLSGADGENYFANNVTGSITTKFVTLTFVYYMQDNDGTTNVINPDLIKDSDTKVFDKLIYEAQVQASMDTLPLPSHEGYIFDGWFFDKEYSVQLNIDTMITSPLWGIDEEEKTVYAKWTIRKYTLKAYIATEVDGIYEAENASGGTISYTETQFNYFDSLDLIAVIAPQAKNGYEFKGYSSNDVQNSIELYETGYIIQATQDGTNKLFVKFAPKTVTLTLYANKGVFSRSNGWEYNSDYTTASVKIKFNSSLSGSGITEIPSINREGYTQDGWTDEDLNIVAFNETTILDDFYFPERTLWASFKAREFKLYLSSNGGYYDNIDENIWTIEERNDDNQVIKVSKVIVYDEEFGELIEPVRTGWSFDSYEKMYTSSIATEYIKSDDIFKQISDVYGNAIYNENDYTLTITALRHNITVQVLDSVGNLKETKYHTSGQEQTIINVKTTSKCIITAQNTQGYLLDHWISTYIDVDNLTTNEITINEFLKDETLQAVYAFVENTITIKANYKHRGYISSGETSSKDKDFAEIKAYTESDVNLVAVANEGYELTNWLIDYGTNPCTLSGNKTDLVRTLSGFVGDVSITVVFESKDLNIEVIASEEKGLLSSDQYQLSPTARYTFTIKTEDVLTFTVTANHGYSVDKTIANWIFETISLNKGEFTITSDNNVYTITFKNFVCDGTIVVPYTTNSFTITFIAVYKNEDEFTIDRDAIDLVTLEKNTNLEKFNSFASYTEQYKTTIKLSPRLDVKNGYTFSCWSKESNQEYPITFIEGLVNKYDDGVIDYTITDDLTLYLIYSINRYSIHFDVNDEIEGKLSYNNSSTQISAFDIEVRYGYNTDVITAISTRYYHFIKWVQVLDDNTTVDLDTSSGNYQLDNTSIIIKNVHENAHFRPIFRGNDLTLKINLILPQEEMLSSQITDFGTLQILEDGNGIVSQTNFTQNNNVLVYEISSIAGQVVTIQLVEENGYIFNKVTPYYNFDETLRQIILSTLYTETNELTIYLKARENKVIIEIIGETNGAQLFGNYSQSIGRVGDIVDTNNKSRLEYTIKTGGSLVATLKLLPGYKMTANNYFEVPYSVADSLIKLSNGKVENISSDITIQVQIVAYIYKIAFDFNYDGCPTSFESIVTIGKENYNPALGNDIINPQRARYRFIGWGTKTDETDVVYFFENGEMYYYSYENNIKTKNKGFAGSNYATDSTTLEVDYDCTLYALWEIITYKVNVVLVPGTTVDKLNYLDIFTSVIGRKIVYSNTESVQITAIEYAPDTQITITAPIGKNGYSYYGWAMEDGLLDINQINIGNYVGIMPNNELTIYLYYLLNVEVVSNSNGTVTVSKKQVLPGETVEVDATPNEGYLFNNWALNGTQIENSTAKMQIQIEKPSTILGNFIGIKVNVILEQVDKATLEIASKIQYTEGEFRVGDTIIFAVKNITYGYKQESWTGEFSGQINNFTYRITKNDAKRTGTDGVAYVLFKPIIVQKTVKVEFVVSDVNAGTFIIDGVSVSNNFVKTYKYDTKLTFGLNIEQKYEQNGLTLNDYVLSNDLREIWIHKDNHFDADNVNIIKVSLRQLLWIEVYEMFTGFGTQNDPYIILNEKQLAAMAYLINNNIEANETTPYAQGYYILKFNMYLNERFWQPIGTEENPFDGTFDFTDNDAYGLTLDKYYEVTNQDGLFGYITENAKFLKNKANYTLAIALVSGIVGAIVVVVIILLLWIRHKKKQMEKLATISTIVNNSTQMGNILTQMHIQEMSDNKSDNKTKQDTKVKKSKPQRKRK